MNIAVVNLINVVDYQKTKIGIYSNNKILMLPVLDVTLYQYYSVYVYIHI